MLKKPWRGLLGVCLLLVASGSHAAIPQKTTIDKVVVCRQWFNTLDQRVASYDVADAQAATITGFPYLRVNRFYGSFAKQSLSTAQFNQWLDGLQQLALEAWAVQLQNLPSAAQQNLQKKIPAVLGAKNLNNSVKICSQVLRQQDMSQAVKRRSLQQNAKVPSNYKTWERIIGLYDLLKIPVAVELAQYRDETHATFAKPLSQLTVDGQLIDYQPQTKVKSLTAKQIAQLLQQQSRHPLRIPLLSSRQRQQLFASFAPVWQIDVKNNNDRIGQLYWSQPFQKMLLNTQRPVTYTLLSYAYFDQQPVVQLNYFIWFPARQKTSALDIYGGYLDGILWRVSLNQQGQVIAYDSIHQCGCFHMFFPNQQLRTKSYDDLTIDEKPLIAQIAPSLKSGQRLVIRISHTAHYIERIYPAGRKSAAVGQSLSYGLLPYKGLRSIIKPNGEHQSLFQPNGLVAGSERLERWILWPMGIPAAGAMRQWGHHATVFVGRGNFDDPRRLDQLFYQP